MRKTNLTSQCLQCNKIFKVLPYELKRGRGKFCSAKCRSLHYIDQLKPFFKKKGDIPWNKGLKGAQVGWSRGLKVPSIGMKMIGNKNGVGHVVTAEQRAALSAMRRGNSLSTTTKKKISEKLLGRKLTEEHIANRTKAQSGENSPFWKGGISKLHKSERSLAWGSREYQKWRKTIFERDNYTCQICGTRGGNLNADHIKQWVLYPELRYNVDNGRTLCFNCHVKTDTWGNRYLTKNRKENNGPEKSDPKRTPANQ